MGSLTVKTRLVEPWQPDAGQFNDWRDRRIFKQGGKTRLPWVLVGRGLSGCTAKAETRMAAPFDQVIVSQIAAGADIGLPAPVLEAGALC